MNEWNLPEEQHAVKRATIHESHDLVEGHPGRLPDDEFRLDGVLLLELSDGSTFLVRSTGAHFQYWKST